MNKESELVNPSGASDNRFITRGSSGILTIRMESSTGYVYDMYIDDSAAWSFDLVSAPAGGGTFRFVDGASFQFIDGTDFDFLT